MSLRESPPVYPFLRADKTSNPEVDLRAAIPSMYVELSRWQESGKEPAAGGDLTNLQHIIERLQSYDPEKQFVVVFQSHGLMGAGRPLLSIGVR